MTPGDRLGADALLVHLHAWAGRRDPRVRRAPAVSSASRVEAQQARELAAREKRSAQEQAEQAAEERAAAVERARPPQPLVSRHLS